MMIRVLALVLFAALPAQAARRLSCNSCETCTKALAAPNAVVKLSADIDAKAEICVDITGADAQFVGDGHTLKTGGVGVRISAPGVNLRRLKVVGGKAGVEVVAAKATLLAVETQCEQGIVARSAPDLRIVRSTTTGGTVGVALGATKGTQCAKGLKMASPGVVISRSTISGAKVGVAACEALPVIADSTLTKNGLGLLVGAPKAGTGPGARAPYDACACGQRLTGLKPETTLFYSSGCGGCKVHEGWLPGVLEQGHDIRLRPTGKENAAKMAQYDSFVRRCAPEINDAIGIPGCVPNYACPASQSVFKRRDPSGRLAFDAQIKSADGMAEFAARCVASAQEHYAPGANCVANAVRNTTLCGNKIDANLSTALKGVDNTCGQIKGKSKALGCAKKCG